MEYWQIIFLNLALIGFVTQLIQFIFFFKRNSGLKKENAKDVLEKIYNRPTSSKNYIVNLSFKSYWKS